MKRELRVILLLLIRSFCPFIMREKKSSVLLDHQFFLSLKQQQYFCERLYIFTKITSNALKTESTTHSRIITCDAARIFFVYILLLLLLLLLLSSSSRDSIKSVSSLSLSSYFFYYKSCFFPSFFIIFLRARERKLVVEKDPKISHKGPQKTRILQHNKIRNTHTHA